MSRNTVHKVAAKDTTESSKRRKAAIDEAERKAKIPKLERRNPRAVPVAELRARAESLREPVQPDEAALRAYASGMVNSDTVAGKLGNGIGFGLTLAPMVSQMLYGKAAAKIGNAPLAKKMLTEKPWSSMSKAEKLAFKKATRYERGAQGMGVETLEDITPKKSLLKRIEKSRMPEGPVVLDQLTDDQMMSFYPKMGKSFNIPDEIRKAVPQIMKTEVAVTDVLPENVVGRYAGEQIEGQPPHIGLLDISKYADMATLPEIIAHEMDHGIHAHTKPITKQELLAEKIRQKAPKNYTTYLTEPTEVDAFTTQVRHHMTPEQRIGTLREDYNGTAPQYRGEREAREILKKQGLMPEAVKRDDTAAQNLLNAIFGTHRDSKGGEASGVRTPKTVRADLLGGDYGSYHSHRNAPVATGSAKAREVPKIVVPEPSRYIKEPEDLPDRLAAFKALQAQKHEGLKESIQTHETPTKDAPVPAKSDGYVLPELDEEQMAELGELARKMHLTEDDAGNIRVAEDGSIYWEGTHENGHRELRRLDEYGNPSKTVLDEDDRPIYGMGFDGAGYEVFTGYDSEGNRQLVQSFEKRPDGELEVMINGRADLSPWDVVDRSIAPEWGNYWEGADLWDETAPWNNREVRQDAQGGDTGEEVPNETASEEMVPGSDTEISAGGPRIAVNPAVFKDKRDALCVAMNEAYRVVMELNGFNPVSEPTDRQREFFSDTAYANDELQLRRTILARICTFDTSVQ